LRLRAYGLTDKGRIRPTNEDCFAVREDLGLCVIADGLGGHNAGEVAARLAVDAVVDYVDEHHARCEHAGITQRGYQSDLWPFGFDPSLSPDGNLLRTAVHAADLQIRETASASQDCAGMGTTIVAVRVASGRLSVAHAGDSRLYVLAGGTLRQVTQDDSWIAAMLADDPDADPAMLALHPMRNALTNVVGAKSRTEVHVVEHTLAGGELLVLSTDGVHGVLDGRRIEEVVREEEEPRAIAHAIVSSALTRGSRDNCTAVVARCVKM
jgi:serine/threonine protein phosphatase PrpC